MTEEEFLKIEPGTPLYIVQGTVMTELMGGYRAAAGEFLQDTNPVYLQVRLFNPEGVESALRYCRAHEVELDEISALQVIAERLVLKYETLQRRIEELEEEAEECQRVADVFNIRRRSLERMSEAKKELAAAEEEK